MKQWDWSDVFQQKWVIVNRGNGYYSIHSAKDTQFVIDVSGGNSGNGTNIQIYKYNGTNAQLFKFTSVSSGGGLDNNSNNNSIISPVPNGAKFSKKSYDGDWYGYHDINRNVSASTPVYAIADGTVTYNQAYRTYNRVQYLTSYGNFIEFTSSNGAYKAKYCHLSRFNGISQRIDSSRTKQVKGSSGKYTLATRKVKKGDLLGYIGTTGNSSGVHLHFELYKNGRRIDPTSVIPGLN